MHPSVAPDQRVHGEWQPAAAPWPGQPGEAAIVIETAVAEHHELDRGRIEVERLEVVVNRRDRIGSRLLLVRPAALLE